MPLHAWFITNELAKPTQPGAIILVDPFDEPRFSWIEFLIGFGFGIVVTWTVVLLRFGR